MSGIREVREPKPIAWMRRWAFDKVDVMAMRKAERPPGWHLHAVTASKTIAEDVPLYAREPPEISGRTLADATSNNPKGSDQ